MDGITQYHTAIAAILQKIVDTQREPIAHAARRLADAIQEDRYIYVIGTGGHSYIACEEMFWRAGGLVPVYPILASLPPTGPGARCWSNGRRGMSSPSSSTMGSAKGMSS